MKYKMTENNNENSNENIKKALDKILRPLIGPGSEEYLYIYDPKEKN